MRVMFPVLYQEKRIAMLILFQRLKQHAEGSCAMARASL